MRLYNAVCAWLEATAQTKTVSTAGEPTPEGNNFTDTQIGHVYSTEPELHNGWTRQNLDDDDGAYRVARPISMRWTP